MSDSFQILMQTFGTRPPKIAVGHSGPRKFWKGWEGLSRVVNLYRIQICIKTAVKKPSTTSKQTYSSSPGPRNHASISVRPTNSHPNSPSPELPFLTLSLTTLLLQHPSTSTYSGQTGQRRRHSSSRNREFRVTPSSRHALLWQWPIQVQVRR